MSNLQSNHLMYLVDFVLCMSATLLLGICAVDLVFDFNAYVPKGAFSPDQLSAFDWVYIHQLAPAQTYYTVAKVDDIQM